MFVFICKQIMGAQHSHTQSHVCGSLNIVDLELVKRDNHLLQEELIKVKCELEKTKQDLEIAKCQVAAFINISHD